MLVKLRHVAAIPTVILAVITLAGCRQNEPDLRAEDVDTAQVIAWIEEEAFPLAATESGEDTSDLEWLREAIGNARIVGLGNQTYGTTESITLNTRIAEFLLEEMGFSLLATTACSWGHSLTADRYVSEGKGRSRGAREGFVPPLNYSTAILDFLVWGRRYALHHPETPLHLVGINALSPHASFEWCKNIFLGAGHTFSQATLQVSERLEYSYSRMWGDRDKQAQYFTRAATFMAEIQDILPEYEHKLTTHQLAIIARIPRALEQLREYLQILDSNNGPNDAGWRQQAFDFYNQSMAENLSWWMETLQPDAKVILWGHNSELAKQWPEAAVRPLGQQLEAIYGPQYVSIGFSAGGGIVYALQRGEEDEYTGYGNGIVPEPIPDSYETVLCNTPLVDYALDLRDLKPNSDVAVWMGESRPFKLLGDNLHTVHKSLDTAFNTPHTLPAMFDLILHVQFATGIERGY